MKNLLVAVALSAALIVPASAATWTSSAMTLTCDQFGQFANAVATGRDQGVSQDTQLSMKTMNENYAGRDLHFLVAIINTVYAQPSTTPEQAASAISRSCKEDDWKNATN